MIWGEPGLAAVPSLRYALRRTEMIFMSVAVWRAHLFSCGWPAKHDHMGFPRKGAGKPRGDISKSIIVNYGGRRLPQATVRWNFSVRVTCW